jgi:pimeloyl-ACP methyl ester carboxylesterase
MVGGRDAIAALGNRRNEAAAVSALRAAGWALMRVTVAGDEVYVYTGARALEPALAAIVFVHGAGNDHSVWALQSRYFAHHGRNALAVDLPGHGRSAGPALASVEALADWIPAFLDAAGIGAATLVGHSMGALAALECAARHPERVTRVALLGPAAPMVVSDVLLDAAKRDDHVAFELINGWSFSAGKQLGGNTMPGVWLTGNALRLLERTNPGVLHTDLVACDAYAGALAAAAKVRCPTLAIVGARDIMAPPKNARELIGALREARLVDLPDCGHAMMAEQPDAVLDALRSFV